MGILSRMSTVLRARMNQAMDGLEDPRETLDLSYEKQLEMLQQVKRSLADVVTARKQVELQMMRLEGESRRLEEEAKSALAQGREDLARHALGRKAALAANRDSLKDQLASIANEETRMEEAERELQNRIALFRSQKELVKAQYTSAEAQVRIGEAATGISDRMADVGRAMDKARDRTDQMKARAEAIDSLRQDGLLEDPLSGADPLDRELRQNRTEQQVNEDLERLKRELEGK